MPAGSTPYTAPATSKEEEYDTYDKLEQIRSNVDSLRSRLADRTAQKLEEEISQLKSQLSSLEQHQL